MIKAVLFDLLGTLVSNPPHDEYAEMVDGVRKSLGVESPEFHERWMEVNDHRLRGHFGSSENEIVDIAKKFGIAPSPETINECVQIRRVAVWRWLTPKPGSENALQHIAERKIKMCLVTDCVFDVPALWPQHPFAKKFDATVFSCIEKVRKPDPHMYQTALTRIGMKAEEAIFIGDGGSGELPGAASQGIDAYLIEHLEDDPTKLMKVGVQDWDGPKVTGFAGAISLFP